MKFLPDEARTLPYQDLKSLKISVFLDQLLNSKDILTRGGVILIMPDGLGGFSRAYPIPIHGRIRNFRASFAELAIETGAALVPVSVAINIYKREVTVNFSDPLDIGASNMDHEAKLEGLIRQYADYLKTEWAYCPGTVPPKQAKNHLDYPPINETIQPASVENPPLKKSNLQKGDSNLFCKSH